MTTTRRPRAGLLRLAVGLALVGPLLVATATGASAGPHAKTTTTTAPAASSAGTATPPTTAPLPPAPAGFAGSLVTLYQDELSTAQALGKSKGFESLAQYKRQVANLNGPTLAAFYKVTRTVPHWNDVPTLMQTIAAGADRSTGAAAGGKTAALSSFIRPATAAQVRSDLHNAVLTGAPPVSRFVPETCPVAPSEASIFAAQIVVDVGQALFNGLVAASNISEFVSNFAAIFLGAIVAVTVVLVALIVHDTLVYEQDLAVDCANDNLGNEVANIDNTTVQTYNLVTTAMTLIVQSQQTESTTEQDVLNLQNELGTVQQTLEQSLTVSTQTLQAALSGGNQSQSTEMQIIQNALQKDLTSIEVLQSTTGTEITGGDTTIELNITNDQTQSIHEIDTDSQSLTSLLTQDNQQITNALNANFAATQGQYNNNLQLLIEQGLAGWGPVVPEVELMTPVKYGGLLNATPVGVQSVVTADIAGLQSNGVKVKALAITDLAAGNTALAAGQYVTAWTDYQIAYQAAA